MIDGEDILNVDEVATLFGLNKNTVYTAARNGEIPHRKVGKRVFFSRRALTDWFQTTNTDPG